MATRHLSTPATRRGTPGAFSVHRTGVRPRTSTPAADPSHVRKALDMSGFPTGTPAPEPAPAGEPEPEDATGDRQLLFTCDFEFSDDRTLDVVTRLLMPSTILNDVLSTSDLTEGLTRAEAILKAIANAE